MTDKTYTLPERIWCGTEHSLQLAQEMHSKIMAGPVNWDNPDDEEKAVPYLLDIKDGVGTISIRGPLINSTSWYHSYFNVASYPAIREALVYAAQSADVQSVLLDIDSGGGSVSGCADTARLIRKINTQVKPVVAFTDGTMCSAAYWLGCSAGEVYSSDTAITGSVGVICTHMEYSKALKDAGVGVTVIRAGEYKALASSVETLSEVAKQQLQDTLNAVYQIFIGHVADMRGTTVNLADQNMGQGREFLGKKALDANLVDGISSFDEVMSKIHAKNLDNQRISQNNLGNFRMEGEMSKKALTEQDIAALAAGATTDVDASAEANVEAASSAEADVQMTETGKECESTQATVSGSSEVVAYLEGQVKAKSDENVNLRVELENLKASAESQGRIMSALVGIAATSVKNMKIALGMSHAGIEAMSAEVLLAEHVAAAEAFNAKFKAGGVAAVSATVPIKKTEQPKSAMDAAKSAAVRFNK